MKTKIAHPLALTVLLTLATALSLQLRAVQAQAVEGEEYIVQADDCLSKLATKFYDDALTYPALTQGAPETVEVVVEPVAN